LVTSSLGQQRRSDPRAEGEQGQRVGRGCYESIA
jgi:hypothetical protein